MTIQTRAGGSGPAAAGRSRATAAAHAPAGMRTIPCRFVVAVTDGSRASLPAAEWAAREAVLHREALRIVALPAFPHWISTRPARPGGHRAARRALSNAASGAVHAEPGLTPSAELLSGPPVQRVLDSTWGASMLVTTSRGRGGFPAIMPGSVSRYLATHTPCPVVMVHSETTAAHGLIVAGIHEPGHAAATLGFAFREAALRRARLLILHATGWPGRPVTTAGSLAWQAVTQWATLSSSCAPAAPADWLDSLLADWQHRHPEVPAVREIVHAHPAQALIQASAQADLLVLGRRKAGTTVGAVIHPVLRHAHGPVAVVATP